jgi:hypothetical protein
MEIIMKRNLIVFILIFAGMPLFAQSADMSSYLNDFTSLDNTFGERLLLLEEVRDTKTTGIGEFYHNALKHLLLRNADIKTRADHVAAEGAALILVQGLGAEKYNPAANELWETADYFDIARDINEGNTMREAYIALGQVGGVDFVPHMAQRLNQFNEQLISSGEAKIKVQLVVIGLINALETLKDHSGFRPVFNVAIGSYDSGIKEMAYNALINIVDDPADLIIEIIEDNIKTDPITMQEAVRVMNRSKAPDSSRARVAAAALRASWDYHTTNRALIIVSNQIRKNAIDDIGKYGVSDDFVYRYLERAYVTSFNNYNTDYDEIMKTLSALAAVKTDDAVALLYKFLKEFNDRRRTGPWDRKERLVFEWVVNGIQLTGTQSQNVKQLLTTIYRSDRYTSQERRLAENALKALQ